MYQILFMIDNLLGFSLSQKLFSFLHLVSLVGMNHGINNKLQQNGEIKTIQYVFDKKKSKKDWIIFDVGANVGAYTKLLLSQPEKKKIYAFEPNKSAFSSLRKNITDDQVKMFNMCLGDKKGTATLYFDKESSELASLVKRRLDHFNIKSSLSEKVKVDTLDSFCTTNHIDRIDFLKIDAEGYDLMILQGSKNMLNKNKIKFIQFEFGGANIDTRTFFQDFYYLLKNNFNLYRVTRNGLYPLTKYSESLEVFIGANYLAELKS